MLTFYMSESYMSTSSPIVVSKRGIDGMRGGGFGPPLTPPPCIRQWKQALLWRSERARAGWSESRADHTYGGLASCRVRRAEDSSSHPACCPAVFTNALHVTQSLI